MSCPDCDPKPREGSTARSRWFGEYLRGKRKANRLSADEVAQELEWAPSDVAALELGERVAGTPEIIKFLLLCRTLRAELREMVAFHAECDKDTWLQTFHGDPAARVQVPLREEARANAITGYHPMIVPGPLRTPEYTRAVHDVDQPQARQDHLERVPSVFYLGEHVPGRVAGNPAVMHGQITHLLTSPSTVLIVPSDSPVVCEGFTILDNVRDRPVVHVEIKVANLFLEDLHQVGVYRRVVTRLAETAWDVDRSRRLLADWAAKFAVSRPE